MTAIVIGFIFMVIGFWGLFHWLPDFILVMKGLGPFIFFISGLVAVIVGLSTLQQGRGGEPKK
ncbi:MAG: hypothetical protein LHV69_02315 [Elusimicrobia bacterium]|nr:hypothetical protein [Candidatus Obscuribacterium magneticum]MCB4755860.1 hypothetical protein [Candidatus Obscuribacterium magneticum]